MGRVNIEFLYYYLFENQKLDPEIARRILLQILEILNKPQESVDNDHEML